MDACGELCVHYLYPNISCMANITAKDPDTQDLRV